MATNQTTPAADSKPPQHKEVENFSEAERAEWLKTGAMPQLEEEKVSPVKKDDTQASSIPVKKAEDQGSAKQDKSAEEKEAEKELNFKALRERTERLEAELEEFRTGKKKVEEKKDAGLKLLELPVRPKMKDFMNTEGALDSDKYETALDKYETDKSAYISQQTQLRTAAAQQEQFVNTWKSELAQKYGDKAKDLDVKKTIDALAKTQTEAPAFFFMLNSADNFSDLLYVLGGKEFKLDELLAEARDPKTVTKAIRKLRDIERDIESELAKQAAAKSKKSDDSKSEEKKDNLTRAGKPPLEAAGGDGTPADDGSPDAAWKRKDLTSEQRGELYRERQNKLEREKRRKKVN